MNLICDRTMNACEEDREHSRVLDKKRVSFYNHCVSRTLMLLLFSSLVLGLITSSSGSFSCSNKVLTSADSPYSFGVPGTTNSYNGVYSCTWTVNVPYMNYALLTTNSLLSASDSVTITYPGGSYTTQLHNAHPQNTFWLPEGQSTVQFVAKSNGTLSFNLQWNKINIASGYYVVVYPNYLPEYYSLQQLTSSFYFYETAGNSKSLALGVAGQNINGSDSNPHPLRACFIFKNYGTNRNFITTFEDIYPNVKLFNNNVTVLCVTNTTFDGMIVGQPGAGASVFSTYTVAIADKNNNSLSLKSNGNILTAVTVVTKELYTHIILNSLTLSNQTSTFMIRKGGAANDVVATFSPSNFTIPFVILSDSATFSVSSGTAQFSVNSYSNVPDGANCPSQALIQSSDSPYSFYNDSQPVPYTGPFSCHWTVYIKPDEYAIMEEGGNLSSNDRFHAQLPNGQFIDRTYQDNRTQKVYLPPGNTTITFLSYAEGTFLMNITWKKAKNQTTSFVKATSNTSTILLDINTLNTQSITIDTQDYNYLDIALATNPINSSVEDPFDCCFVMNTRTKQFQTWLNTAIGNFILANSSSCIYCVEPVTYASGYIVVENSKNNYYSHNSVSLLSNKSQIINVYSGGYMTVTLDNKTYTRITDVRFSSQSTVLTVFEGQNGNSRSFSAINISYPIDYRSQITTYAVFGGSTNVTVEPYNFVTMNVVSPMVILAVVFSLI